MTVLLLEMLEKVVDSILESRGVAYYGEKGAQ